MDREAPNIRLIASDDAEPRVRLAVGKRYEVIATTIVDHNLDDVAEEAKDPALRPPRLCGSKSTCVAIVETSE